MKMSMQEYLDLPAVSAGLITDVLDCPKRAWFNSWLNPQRVRETSAEMDAGSIAHMILLEGNADCCVVIDPDDHPNQKGGGFATGWTNNSIRAARDAVRASGKIPILKPAIAEISAMAASALEFIDSLKDTEPAIWAAFQTDGGESEATYQWLDAATPCKMRPDRISSDYRLIVDAKFTSSSAAPDGWSRKQLVPMGYYVSAAFYRRGIEALFGVSPNYVFLVVESSHPYLCSLVGMDPRSFDIGGQKVSLGLQEWERCVKANDWPGYAKRVCYPELPVWLESELEERQIENYHYASQA